MAPAMGDWDGTDTMRHAGAMPYILLRHYSYHRNTWYRMPTTGISPYFKLAKTMPADHIRNGPQTAILYFAYNTTRGLLPSVLDN